MADGHAHLQPVRTAGTHAQWRRAHRTRPSGRCDGSGDSGAAPTGAGAFSPPVPLLEPCPLVRPASTPFSWPRRLRPPPSHSDDTRPPFPPGKSRKSWSVRREPKSCCTGASAGRSERRSSGSPWRGLPRPASPCGTSRPRRTGFPPSPPCWHRHGARLRRGLGLEDAGHDPLGPALPGAGRLGRLRRRRRAGGGQGRARRHRRLSPRSRALRRGRRRALSRRAALRPAGQRQDPNGGGARRRSRRALHARLRLRVHRDVRGPRRHARPAPFR